MILRKLGKKVIGAGSTPVPVGPNMDSDRLGTGLIACSDRSRVGRNLADTYENLKGFKAFFTYDGGLTVSLYGHFRQEKNYCADLMRFKSQARDNDNADFIEVLWRGHTVQVYGHGARGGVSYTYMLLCEGFRFYVHRSPCAGIPGLRVKCEYDAMRNISTLQDLQDKIYKLVSDLFYEYEVEDEVLSRIDLAVTCNVSMDFFSSAYWEDRFVGPGQWNLYDVQRPPKGEDSAGVYPLINSLRCGSIEWLEIAIYDKAREALQSKNKDKVFDVYSVFSPEESVTRIEFRCGREFLNGIGVTSLADFAVNEDEIIDYLTYDRFRICDKKTTDIKYCCANTWRAVRYVFRHKNSGNFIVSIMSGKRLVKRRGQKFLERMAKQAAGAIASGLREYYDSRPVKGSAKESKSYYRPYVDIYARVFSSMVLDYVLKGRCAYLLKSGKREAELQAFKKAWELVDKYRSPVIVPF